MSAPGLRKAPVSASSGGAGAPGARPGSDRAKEKRLGSSGSSSGGIGGLVRGPSPRATPRSASSLASRERRSNSGTQSGPNVSSVGLPPSLPLLRQEA